MAAILFYVRKNELNYLDFYFALWIVLYAFCLHSHCPFGGEKKKKLPSVPDVAKQFSTSLLWTSQVTQQAVKDPPAMQEMLVQSLGWGDPLQKEMATHSSFFAWEIP